MTTKEREPKPTDAENTRKAYNILIETMTKHMEEIEPTIFTAAMFYTIAACYKKSQIPKEIWKEETAKMTDTYFNEWENL